MAQGVGTEVIGWVSSVVLILTIAKQIYKQWQEGSSKNVSKWLFIGQLGASLGFTGYSWLVGNWVFVVTNAIMVLNGIAGLLIVLYHRRRARQKEGRDRRGAGTLEVERA